MSALVSVIIPVYNLENYIGNCLNSIVNQTYTNLEILCVDDGSSDRSAEIIRSFCEKDGRVKYFYQENAGVSAARNSGLEKASGEYIMFVDGDDYLHSQTVEILLDGICRQEADISCVHFKITDSLTENQPQIGEYEFHIADDEGIFTEKYNSVIGKSSCAKLIKSDCARQESFPVGIANGEDGYYIILLLSHNPKVVIADLQLYFYYTRENSAVTSLFTMKNYSITYSFDRLCDRLVSSSNAFLKKYCLQYLFQTIFYNRTRAIGTDCEKEVLTESKRIGKKWIGEFLRNKEISLVIKIMFTVFFYSRPIYELVRAIKDPTMFDFYKNRRKGNNAGEA